MSREPDASDLVSDVLTRLRATSHPPSRAEVGALVRGELAIGGFRKAAADWRRLASPVADAASGDLSNGRFLQVNPDTPFDWTIAPDAGGAVSLGAGDGGAQLRVVLMDRDPNAPFMSQLLALAPGAYRLSGTVRLAGVSAAQDDGLVWIVRCADTGEALGKTDSMRAGDSWSAFEAGFTVPQGRCAGQYLDLKRRGSLTGAADQSVVFFDHFAVTATAGP